MDILMHPVLKSFAGKRIFITGHTGFKGSWLAFLLKEVGAEVIGYALPPHSHPNHFDLLQLKEDITHIEGDVTDLEQLKQVMMSFQPELVFHLAAQALVKKSYEDPAATMCTNVLGSTNLLESIRHCSSIRALVYITSDKCYENIEWIWGYRENDRLGGHDPYSASKAAAEIVFASYFKSYFQDRPNFGAATVRAGNVIGGGDWAVDRIIPDCIRAIEKQGTIQLRHPKATRPWQHVLEPLSGYLLLATKLLEAPTLYSSAWNFGPSAQDVRSVYDVATRLVECFGQGRVEIVNTTKSLHEAQLLQLNCDKAHQYLGWYPKWGVDKTILATANWYKELMAGKDAMKITCAQIYDYFSVA